MNIITYIIYSIHLLWLLGCVYYCIFTWLSNHQGHPKNENLSGKNLKITFFLVLAWFIYIVARAYDFYMYGFVWDYGTGIFEWVGFLITNLFSLEILNLLSTIFCTLRLLGFNFNKK